MTEKLYYIDAYINSFMATVLSVETENDSYAVILDKTAFFPNEGGQAADTGKIADATVLDVVEKNGTVIHKTDKPLTAGDTVECQINFAERYEKMKCHTAEHILCGIMHRLYGAENIGFHLGDDVVTFDVSPVLTREQLDEVESLANRIVAENVAITTLFPTSEQLSAMEYRAKLDITENVRIVNIGEYDSCACCAPHVARTGEIGLIKMLDFCKHRGGTRIYMVAGERALLDYRMRYAASQKISALTSTPQADIVDAVVALQAEREALKLQVKERGLAIVRILADSIPATDGNVVRFFDGLTMDELREFVNITVPKVQGVVVALVGGDGDYKYIIGSMTTDLRAAAKEINAALNGRGGGKPEMIQGTFLATRSEIEAYFTK
ncbi:MAG: hypothetical protein IKV43_04670 [Clostridia bacterium]|nr:hypothetical protein [Clostridia bacterium]